MDTRFQELFSYALTHINGPSETALLKDLAHLYTEKMSLFSSFYNTASTLEVSFNDICCAYALTHRLLDAACMICDTGDGERIFQEAETPRRPSGYWRLWSPTILDGSVRGYICVSQ